MSGFCLHLLRHGAPERPGLMLGRQDDAPTPAGIAACVRQVENLPFEAVTGSGLRRSSLAAEAIAQTRTLTATTDPRWREMDFGAWDGLAPAEIDREALGRFWNDPDANPPPQGEKWSSLVARVTGAIDALPHRPTLVVTHGGTMRAALAALFGFDHPHLWAFDLPYAALVSLRIWPDAGGGRPTAQIIGLRS